MVKVLVIYLRHGSPDVDSHDLLCICVLLRVLLLVGDRLVQGWLQIIVINVLSAQCSSLANLKIPSLLVIIYI